VSGNDAERLGPPPLIVTLRFDQERQAWFDRLREAHFPAARNVLAAHATLFHKLPGELEADIAAELQRAAGSMTAPTVEVCGPYSLGGGVAYRLGAPEVISFRRRIAELWSAQLSPQDQAWGRLHVTVQNKVAPERARLLLAELSEAFRPDRFVSPGIALWRYLGGPWSAVAEFDFAH
jgi:hypothetical protein